MSDRGLPEPEDDHEHGGQHVEPDPVDRGNLVPGEVGTDEQLVEERERDGQVGVDVQPVPRLVRESPARRSQRRHADKQEEREPDEAPQDELELRQQVDELGDDRAAVAQGPAGQREHDVTADEPYRGEPQPPVGPCEPVRPERLVQPRTAAHQDELDQGEVGPQEGGDLPGGGKRASGRPELLEPAVADPHQDDEDAVGDEQRRDIPAGDAPPARQRDGTGTRRAGGCHEAMVGGGDENRLREWQLPWRKTAALPVGRRRSHEERRESPIIQAGGPERPMRERQPRPFVSCSWTSITPLSATESTTMDCGFAMS